MSEDQEIAVIGPFQAESMNLDGNDQCAGLPSPTALLGFCDALSRLCTPDGKGASSDIAAALLIHRLELSSGQVRPSPEKKGDGYSNISIPEKLIGNGVCTVLIRGLGLGENRIRKTMPFMRFAGSPIFPPANQDRLSRFTIRYETSFADSMKRLRSGRFLAPRPDLCAPAGEDVDSLQALASRLGYRAVRDPVRQQHKDDGSAEESSLQSMEDIGSDDRKIADVPTRHVTKCPGWIVPVPVGYRALESIENARYRKGTRGTEPHIFATNLSGLAEIVSPAAARRREMEFNDIAWSWLVDRGLGTIVATSPAHARDAKSKIIAQTSLIHS